MATTDSSATAPSTGRVRIQTTPATSADQENSGARNSDKPGLRSVSTVVTTQTHADDLSGEHEHVAGQ